METQMTETTLIDRLLKLTKSKNAAELADSLGVFPQALTYWNRVGRLPMARMFQIEKVFGIPFDKIDKLNAPTKRKPTGRRAKARAGFILPT
jgi:hypothetical protein